MLPKQKNGFLMILITFFLIGRSLFSQPPEIRMDRQEESPNFYYDLVTRASEDSGMSRLQIYSQIIYDELQFVQKDTAYQAKYELNVTIVDKSGNEIVSKILNKKIEVTSFKKTNSRTDFDTELVEFNLKPDHYFVIVGIEDSDSKKVGFRKTEIELIDYNQLSLGMSSIILAEDVHIDSSGGIHIRPNVVGDYKKNQDTIYVWLEIYNGDLRDSVRLNYTIRDLSDEVQKRQTYFKLLHGLRTIEVLKIPREALYSGKFVLEITLDEGDKVKQTKNFSIEWLGMPAYSDNLDNAIEQLRYIAKRKEIKRMKKAKGEEKRKLFNQFWASKDPSPETEGNSVMEEYYRRVAISNTNFGAHEDGWKTDRGMVYIMLGSPNEIERHPFEMSSKPYEVWIYYHFQREFVFVDQTGFGDYRLITSYSEIYEALR